MTVYQNPYLTAINALNRSGIRYCIVGGFAVVMHGLNRFTPDLNVVVDLESDLLPQTMGALHAQELTSVDDEQMKRFCDPDGRAEMCKNGKSWFLTLRDVQSPTFSLDLFLQYPHPFEELYASSKVCQFGEEQARISSREHLIEMKVKANRGQDRVDVDILRYIGDHFEELKDPKKVEMLLAEEGGGLEKDYLRGLGDFAEMNESEKLEWLLHMLTHLGKFCVL